MLPQTEEIRTEDTIGGQTVPLNNVAVGNSPRRRWLALAIALLAVAALLISGIWSRVRARTTLNAETAQTALPPVSVVSPKQTAPAEEIILPGNVQPFISSPIYARDRKSTRLNSSHLVISYAVFCLKKKKKKITQICI